MPIINKRYQIFADERVAAQKTAQKTGQKIGQKTCLELSRVRVLRER